MIFYLFLARLCWYSCFNCDSGTSRSCRSLGLSGVNCTGVLFQKTLTQEVSHVVKCLSFKFYSSCKYVSELL